MTSQRRRCRKPIGGELIIPVAAVAFTLYYFSTIFDSPWTAQVSAFFVGTILILLVADSSDQAWRAVLGGEASLGLGAADRAAHVGAQAACRCWR